MTLLIFLVALLIVGLCCRTSLDKAIGFILHTSLLRFFISLVDKVGGAIEQR
jgi:hypothetical protein